MNRAQYIRRLAEKLMLGESTETYPAEEIAETREYIAEAFWPAGVLRFIPCQNCNGTGVLNADATGHEHCEECETTGRIKV